MTSMETKRYEMLDRVREFGDAHADLFPASSLAREQFAAVAAAVTELSAFAVKKMSAANEGTRRKAAARQTLRDRLEVVALTGRALAQTTPGLEDTFRLPRPQADQALLTTGRLFAEKATPLEAEFIAHAMPATFIADLNTAVAEFEAAIHHRSSSLADSAVVRQCITHTLAAGTAAALRLDAMIANHLAGDPTITARWTRDRRVEWPRRRSQPSASEAPVAEPTPATSPDAGTVPDTAPSSAHTA